MNKTFIILELILITNLAYCQDYVAFKSIFKHTDKIDVIATCDKYYATGSDDGTVIVRDYFGKKILKYNIREGRVDALAFLDDSRSLLIAIAVFNSEGYKRYIINKIDILEKHENSFIDKTLTQEQVEKFYRDNTKGSVNAIKTASEIFPDFNIKANSGIPQVDFGLSHIESIQSIGVSPDQRTIASIDKFNILKIWNSSGDILKSFRITNGKKDTYLYFISDTSIMITPNIFLDIESENVITFNGFDDYMSIPLNDKIYYYYDYSETSKAEKLVDIQSNAVINIDTKNIYSILASKSDSKFALLGVDGLIRIRDTNGNILSTFGADRSLVTTFRGEKLLLRSKICQIEFSPHGEYLISGDEEGKEIIWKLDK